MAWSGTYTYTAFEVLTASNLNQYMSANLAYLKTTVDNLAQYALEVIIGDGIEVIPTSPAVKGYVEIPFAATVGGWTLVGDASGSLVLDVLKSDYAGFPPTASIAGTEKPTIASAQKGRDLSLSSWTAAISQWDWLAIKVDSVTTIKQATLSLRLTRS